MIGPSRNINDIYDRELRGIKIDTSLGTFSNSGSGVSTNIGLDVKVGGGDVNYSAIFSGGNVGIGTASPSAKLSVKSSGTQSSNAYLITNADNTNLLYGNESGTYFNAANGSLVAFAAPAYSYGLQGTFIGSSAYAALDIGIVGLGAYISLSHNNSDTTIWTSTTIGGSSRGYVGYSARVAISGDGSLGLRNIGFGYNGTNGSTIYAIGNEDDAFGSTIVLKNVPTQFGITSSDINNAWRVGIGTSSVSTHRVVISEGLKVIGTASGKAIQIIDGTQGDGYVLTSDTNGVGTWASIGSIGIGTTNKSVDTRGFTASVTETITHNLNSNSVIVQNYDSTGLQVIAGSVLITGTGSVDITFSQTLSNVKTIIIG